MLALVIVETEPGANAGSGLSNCRIGVKINLLVFEAALQPLDKDVVQAPALAVHADHDRVPFQGAGKVVAGELTALIGIEDLWRAIARERFLKCLDTEIGASVLESRQVSTARLTPSMITTKQRKPLAIRI